MLTTAHPFTHQLSEKISSLGYINVVVKALSSKRGMPLLTTPVPFDICVYVNTQVVYLNMYEHMNTTQHYFFVLKFLVSIFYKMLDFL